MDALSPIDSAADALPVDASLALAASGAPLCARLADLAVLRFSGADAAAFLHGQLSCHVTQLAPGAATWGSYNTPKGRMLASFLLVRTTDDFAMILSRSIAPATAKRLRMFVLRSKVTVTELADDWTVLGVVGADTASAARADVHRADVSANRGILFGLTAAIEDVVAALGVARVDPAAWRWLDIRDGFPWITARTQDHLVPQMANLDAIGGVHFQKGCYPGQEIVARTQYLGKVKRRLYRAHVAAPTAPEEGQAVFGRDLGDQSSGEIVNVAPAPEGGFEVLAVMHSSTAETSEAHLGAADGPRLEVRPLPYTA